MQKKTKAELIQELEASRLVEKALKDEITVLGKENEDLKRSKVAVVCENSDLRIENRDLKKWLARETELRGDVITDARNGIRAVMSVFDCRRPAIPYEDEELPF